MPSLASRETDTYESLWGVPDYANTSPGGQLVPAFLDMAGIEHPFRYSVLDAGCGSGKGAVALKEVGFTVTMCDLTNAGLVPEAAGIPFQSACLWHPLRHVAYRPFRFAQGFDYVYCCDVLEHIPPTFAMLVIQNLLSIARKGVFLSIALQEDNFGIWAGRPLHLCVQNFMQWKEQLAELGHVRESRDMLMEGIYFVEPR